MSKVGREVISALKQAIRHAEGKSVKVVEHEVEVPDVKAIRRQLKMSQQAFSTTFRIPLATLKNWEQGRRLPDAPTAAYLRVIERRPKAAIEALAG